MNPDAWSKLLGLALTPDVRYLLSHMGDSNCEDAMEHEEEKKISIDSLHVRIEMFDDETDDLIARIVHSNMRESTFSNIVESLRDALNRYNEKRKVVISDLYKSYIKAKKQDKQVVSDGARNIDLE